MRQQMFNAGYTKDQREIIEGLAQMDSSTGKFFVNVKGVRRDIADLTSEELKYLKGQSKSLEQRAKDAQAFDEQFKIFIMELKAVGLPLLQGINALLNDTIRPAMDRIKDFMKDFSDSTKDTMKKIGGGVLAILALKPILGPIANVVFGVFGLLGRLGRGVVSKIFGGGGRTAAATMTGGAAGAKGGLGAGIGAGFKAIGKGAGVGLAAAGIGGGIKLASEGVASLVESMSKLDEKQMEQLKWILIGMPAAWTGMALLASIGPLQIGFGVATVAAIGFGLALERVGHGVQLATDGIAGLIKTVAESGEGFIKFGDGLGSIIRNVDQANFGTLFKLGTGLAVLSAYSDDIMKIGQGFGAINATLSTSKDDYAEVKEAVEAIATADFSNLSALSNLNQLFSQPLQVEFADKEVSLLANITMEIDGDRFVENLKLEEKIGVLTRRKQQGK
jgi:hypothetical protein